MNRYEYDIAIIGGGAAGLSTAVGAAKLGAKTLLIEKEARLGGDCLHFGCVPSKTLIHSAKRYHQMQQGPTFGLPEISPPPVSFPKIRAHIQSVIDTIQQHDSVKRFTGLGVDVQFGTPQFSDEHVVVLGNRRISAKSWVIATGSSPAPPQIDCLKNISIITNKEIFSLTTLPQHLVILGAGPIAIEMAQAFCRLGSTVSVIQRSDQILSKEDKDMADAVMQQLQQEGIRFFLNASVTDARKTQGLQEIQIQQGKLVTTLQADSVLLAQGRTPNVDNLQLSHIDLDYTKRGIRVDSRMRSSHKHIYAPGDVNGAFQFTHAAGYEASIVIANAIFHLPRKTNFKWMPWCTYTDPELASIGMNEKMASTANIPYSVISEAFSNNDRALTKGEQTGTIKLLLDAKERPLGVQIFGPRAGDLMGEWVAALNGGVKLSSLAGAIHPYPTLVEINKLVSSKPISQKIFSNKIRKILKIVFSLQGNPNNITF